MHSSLPSEIKITILLKLINLLVRGCKGGGRVKVARHLSQFSIIYIGIVKILEKCFKIWFRNNNIFRTL